MQEGIYDRFVARCIEEAGKITLGDPLAMPLGSTAQGPQVSRQQFDKILHYIDAGKRQGARLCCGGQRAGERGYFIQPTVFADVTEQMTISQEEIFVRSLIRLFACSLVGLLACLLVSLLAC